MSDHTILSGQKFEHCIDQLTHLMIQKTNADEWQNSVFLGIQSGGVKFANLLIPKIEQKIEQKLVTGVLDTTMYRDDIGRNKSLPIIHETQINFSIDNKILYVVDDVLHTGRTIRAALDAISNFGRPSIIRLVVLIDRGGWELPIRADFAGMQFPIAENEWICFEWEKTAKLSRVFIRHRT